MNIGHVFILIGNINFLSIKVKEENTKKEPFNIIYNLLLATSWLCQSLKGTNHHKSMCAVYIN